MKHRVIVGLDYPDPKKPGHEKRAEVGAIVDDLPKHFVGTCAKGCTFDGEHGWGVKLGYVEKVEPEG